MAAVYNKPGEISIKLQEIPTPEPGPRQVLVKITHSGVCHSDLGIMTNAWKWLPEPVPAHQVGGHEGVGVVVKTGPDCEDSKVKVGDRVGIKYFADVCLDCTPCKLGHEGFCFNGHVSGYLTPGTFQQYVVSSAYYVTPIPNGLPSEIAAPMLCGGLTVYSALKKTNTKPGDWVVISGAGGGLGHLACQIGSRGMGLKILGIDTQEKEVFVREECGVEAFVALDKYPRGPAGDKEITAAVKSVTEGGEGVAAVVVCTAANAAYTQALDFLRFGGTLVCVGIPEGTAVPIQKADPTSIMLGLWHITASSVGSQQEAIETLELTARGVVTPKFTMHRIEELEDLFKRMERGQIMGRTVVTLN
ncbi:hypothetical protein BP6252_10757 [Coleophoma cylindrospora]|uniref:Enoyl reductase (ER) domain-containing protein n=1 Tax=Coleophoma cylindrospora TaxID=1849047 RepID=A0A3D8QTE2_9HELO|nr:hypothetical protein BP6252_10757 [Coleophoma cylindrospora]